MSVTYDYYRIFYYVGKCRSISRAARMLLQSQPNITRAMNNLEAQLGCKLMIRSARGIELTKAGEQLFAHVSIAAEHLQAGEREIRDALQLNTGELFVAATEIALHSTLLPALQQFRRNYPGIHIRISNYSSFEAINAVKTEHAELAVVTLADNTQTGMACIPLDSYTEILTAGLYYKELGDRTYSLYQLTEHPWISLSRDTQTFRFYDNLFMEKGLHFEPELQAATMDQILPMVKCDLGLAFLPEFIAEPAISAGAIIRIPLAESIPERRVCVLYRDKRTLSAAAKELLNLLKKDDL